MRTETTALVIGNPDTVESMLSLFEHGRYDVMFPESCAHAYTDIKRLRPKRVILCTTLEDADMLLLLTMLRLDRATCDIPVLAVTPYGTCDFVGIDNHSSN
jgi:DNA-binding response OmpR family regulator